MLTYMVYHVGFRLGDPPNRWYPLVYQNGIPLSIHWHKLADIETRDSYATREEAEVAGFNALVTIGLVLNRMEDNAR